MTDAERLSKLRHDISNPLAALLAETQLLLLSQRMQLGDRLLLQLSDVHGRNSREGVPASGHRVRG